MVRCGYESSVCVLCGVRNGDPSHGYSAVLTTGPSDSDGLVRARGLLASHGFYHPCRSQNRRGGTDSPLLEKDGSGV